ncbi:MAG: hypothetical protein NVSMB64_20010 [Candidatus Velthaea sp.]
MVAQTRYAEGVSFWDKDRAEDRDVNARLAKLENRMAQFDLDLDRLDKITSTMAADFAAYVATIKSGQTPSAAQQARFDAQLAGLEAMGKSNAPIPTTVPPLPTAPLANNTAA